MSDIFNFGAIALLIFNVRISNGMIRQKKGNDDLNVFY